MSVVDAVESAERAGVVLRGEGERLIAGPKPAVEALPATVRDALSANRERIVAALKLREVHRAMGFSEEDVMFIEHAILSGKVSEIRVAARPSELAS